MEFGVIPFAHGDGRSRTSRGGLVGDGEGIGDDISFERGGEDSFGRQF